MEEVDNDDLLQNSEDEWMTETEETSAPSEKQYFVPVPGEAKNCRSKFKFVTLGIVLIISATVLLITLPLYLKSVDIKGDSYVLLFFTSGFTTVILATLTILWHRFYTTQNLSSIWKQPTSPWYYLKIGFALATSAILTIFSMDRKRVLCHLQDPIKGIVLVFSLIFYFFFCRKLMGLQRIFSCTTIIVGLFISVDYGLCDEFRCRGYERENRSEDAGNWSTRMHALWAGIYVIGLGFYAAHFTLLERCVVPVNPRTLIYTSVSSSLLSTVSRMVASNDETPLTNLPGGSGQNDRNQKKFSALVFNTFVHSVVFFFIVGFAWIDFIPDFGKNKSVGDFFGTLVDGLRCHFRFPDFFPGGDKKMMAEFAECGFVSNYAWTFLVAYVVFSTCVVKFLMISQSAVFTVSMVTISLPIVGIWWSMFQMTELHSGLLIWSPSISGELICSLLGLPIVLLGICLLYKSHFKEISEERLSSCCNESILEQHEYSSTSTRLA